jgi:hypothetical protein
VRLPVPGRFVAVAALLLTASGAAQAHLQILRGRLVDAVQRSDLVVIGRVQRAQASGARTMVVTVQVDATLQGGKADTPLVVHSPSGLAPGQRYVLFLERSVGGWRSVAPSGTLFPARAEDDSGYERAVVSIRAALDVPVDGRLSALRAALIDALSASAPALRYYAALDLVGIGHGKHSLSASERAALAHALDAPGADPNLRPLLSPLLQPGLP